ncbi:MAG: helix-turn-helix domain-containing protein [Candidatus Izemoplasmatales bacterium]
MINNIEIGQFIQNKRKALSLTQKDLAMLLSVTPQAVSKWETGETLPDTAILLDLASALETTVDRILLGGIVIAKKHKRIDIPGIIEGLASIANLKVYFGENSTFYLGAIEGINKLMNIDFEKDYQDTYSRDVLISEVIIQYLIDGYFTTKEEVETYVHSDKMKNIIFRYIGEESKIKLLHYQDDPSLFEKIRVLEPEFSHLEVLNQLPGEFLRLDKTKNYWASEIDTTKGFCYGIAVDESTILVVSYEFGGTNVKMVHQVPR